MTNNFRINNGDLAEHVGELSEQVTSVNASLEQKLNKNGIVTMANLGQDIRENLTGGSVAVVEGESVGINNILPYIKQDFTEEVSIKNGVVWNDKNYIIVGDTATLGDSSAWKNTVINCAGGDRFKVTFKCQGGSSTYGLIFVDINFKVIGKELYSIGSATLHTNYEVVIPPRTSKMIINNNDVYIPISYFNLTKLEYIGIASQKYVDNSLQNQGKINDIVIESGTLASHDGSEVERDTRCRTKFLKLNKGTVITCSDNLKFLVVEYNEDLTFISTTGFLNEKTYTINKTGIYRLCFAFTSDITITDIDYFNNNINIYSNLFTYENISYNYIPPEPEATFEVLDYYTSLDVIEKINTPSSPRNDISFVRNQLWIFDQSNDEGTDTALVRIYDFDDKENTFTLNRNINHNLGHCNSINYCEDTDTLICGNGSGDYSLKGKIYIIENAYNRQSIMQNEIIVIDDSSDNLGSKYNVVWGESNCCEYDLAYLMLDDGKTIHKIQLGQWDNNLGRGEFRSPTTRFNGTYKIIETQTQREYGYDYVIQGADFYNNKLIYGYGHNTGSLSFKTVQFKNNKMIINKYNVKKNNLDGTTEKKTTTSITKFNDNLIVCSGGNMYFCKI